MKPDASNIGVVNPYRWIHYDKDGLHYYEKEFTQNGTYIERCEDTLGNTKEITFTIDLLSSVQNEAPVSTQRIKQSQWVKNLIQGKM